MSYIKGIDVSNNNGSIDFSGMGPNDGVEIVYLKATEGGSFKDKYMEQFYSDCKAQGFKVGAYHFLVHTATPEDQAANFYSKIKDFEWDCVPMLDVETNFGGLPGYITRFINAFKQLSPLTLGIYSYTSFLPAIEDAANEIKDMPFWEANYNNDPWNLGNTFFTNRVGHQYTETGVITGITSDGCDVDSFTEGVFLDSTDAQGEWILKDGKWWFEHKDGSYTSNDWEKIGGKWYFFDKDGWMVYNWRKDGNSWYFLGNANDGAMKTGWFLDNGKWYYFDSNGAMRTGWTKIGEDWFYLDHSGIMQTGWLSIDNKDYLTYSTGEMAHDCDYLGYHFDSNGVATKL